MSNFSLQNSLQVNCEPDDFFHLEAAANRRFFLYGAIPSIGEYDGFFHQCSAPTLVERIISINREDMGIKEPKDRKPIVLYINSVGGDVKNGFSLIRFMELSKTPIYTVNIGMWASMAFYIGIAGHKRFSLPDMEFLLHEGYSGFIGSTHQVQDEASFEKYYEENVIKPHVLKHSKMKEKQYLKMATREFYMLPEEAKRLGFIDKIIDDIDTIL